MRYFIVRFGYEPGEFIQLDETELDKAIYAHLTGKTLVLNKGTVSGKYIHYIKEDYHRAMGWNPTYKLGPEDFAEFNLTKGAEYEGFIAEAKSRVLGLMEKGRTDLIGNDKKLLQ